MSDGRRQGKTKVDLIEWKAKESKIGSNLAKYIEEELLPDELGLKCRREGSFR